ncbi:MAG: tetratricopeptide repeat protein [Parvularculaceae bacterium]
MTETQIETADAATNDAEAPDAPEATARSPRRKGPRTVRRLRVAWRRAPASRRALRAGFAGAVAVAVTAGVVAAPTPSAAPATAGDYTVRVSLAGAPLAASQTATFAGQWRLNGFAEEATPGPVAPAGRIAAEDARDDGRYWATYRALKNLARQGDVDAQRDLGALYERGLGVVRDIDRAGELYRLAAASGDARAHTALGLMALKGRRDAADAALASPDVEIARVWLERARAAGEPRARAELAKLTIARLGGAQPSLRD